MSSEYQTLLKALSYPIDNQFSNLHFFYMNKKNGRFGSAQLRF